MGFRALALWHLLGTAILAALTLLVSIRFPEPSAERLFRLTLALLALSALAAIPLFSASAPGRLLLVPLAVFVAGTLAFLVFCAKVISERYRALRRRRRRR